jgi:hypothetical protein
MRFKLQLGNPDIGLQVKGETFKDRKGFLEKSRTDLEYEVIREKVGVTNSFRYNGKQQV